MSDVRMNRIGTDYEFSNINDHHRNINEKNNYIDRPPPPSSPRKTNNKPFASPEDMYQQRNNINTGGGGGEVVYVAPPAQHHHQRQQPHRNGGGRPPPPPPPRRSPPRSSYNNQNDDDYDNRSYYSEAISERERQSRGGRRPAPPPPPHYRDQHDFNASLGSLDLDDSYRNTGSNNSHQQQQQSSRLHNSHPNFEYHHDHNDDNRSHYSEVSGGGRSRNSQQQRQQYSPGRSPQRKSSPHRNTNNAHHNNDDHDDDRSHYSFGERQERRRASGFIPPAKPSLGVSRNKSDGYNSFDNRGGDAGGGERQQQQQQTRSAEFAPPPSFRNNIKNTTDDSDNRSQYSKEAYSATGGKERNQRRQPTDIFAPPPPRPIQNGGSANNSPGRTRQQQQQQRPYLPPPANSQHYGGGGSVGGGNSAGYLPPQHHHQNDPIHDIMGAAGDFDNLEIQSYAGGGEGNRRRSNFDCGSTISSKAEYTLTGGDGSVVPGSTAASSRQQRIRDNYNTYQQQQQEQSQRQPATNRRNGGGISQEGHKVIQKLKKEHGFPTGLATALYTNQNAFHHRIWIVDNSGSMIIGDGHAIPDGNRRNKRKGNKDGMITRWEELQETVLYHTQMASLLQSQTTFTLLNKPDQAGCPQTFTVADSKKKQCGFDFDEKEEIKYAESIISQVKPQGVTPLSQHIYNIHNTITKLTPELQRNGQRVAIILATDGLPTDDDGYGGNEITLEFINALKSLEGLPVWLVIRLCTDETKVTSFYNDLDQHLEFSLEVLDDFLGEAREVYKENKWLNYALPMHRCRELGYHDRLFDLIDERPLTKGELRDMVVLLFGSNGNNTTTIINSTTEEPNTSNPTNNIPNPHTEWKEFLKYIHEQLKNEQEQYNPIKKKMMPWINLRTLHKIYGKDGNCTIQ